MATAFFVGQRAQITISQPSYSRLASSYDLQHHDDKLAAQTNTLYNASRCILIVNYIMHSVMFTKFSQHPGSPQLRKGFALISTITVMVLLVILTLGMVSLSTVETRLTDRNAAQAIAYSNARLALMMAIGQLQQHAGADQRITAQASILEAPDATTPLANRNWTGVWRTDGLKNEFAAVPSTPPLPIIHRSKATSGANFGSLVDRRATQGVYHPKDQVLDWLVSTRSTTIPDPANPLPDSPHRITLVGNGSAANAQDHVYAEKITITKDSVDTGSCAWWIGDESTKARFNLASPPIASTEASCIPAQNGPNIVTDFANYELLTDDVFPKIITRASTDISGIDVDLATSQTARRKHFHDFSFTSRSILADTQNGGLRKDLSYFFAHGSAPELDPYTHTGLLSSTPIFNSDALRLISPQFGLLQKWAALTKTNDSTIGIDPMFAPGVANGFNWGWNDNYRHPNNAIDLTKQDTPAMHPIMVDAGISYGISLEKIGTPSAGVTSYRVNIHYFPRVVLWNPYNVKFKSAKYAVHIAMPHRFKYHILIPGQAPIVAYFGENNAFTQKYHNSPTPTNSPLRPVFSIPGTAFEPGEALLFTADAGSAPNGSRYWGKPFEYDSNTSAKRLSHFTLSCNKSAPFHDNFYLEHSRTLDIPDDKLNDTAYQVYTERDDIYKLFFYLLYLQNGTNDNAAQVMTDLKSFPPLQTITQTENGSSGSDAPWADPDSIPPSTSTPLRIRTSASVTPHYRFKWGHRIQWINDTIENQTIKLGPYNTPYLSHNTIANHNMRATWNMRSPVEVAYRTTGVGDRSIHGNIIDDFYGWDWSDSTLYPVPVAGKNRVSPFGRPAEYQGQTFPLLDVPSKQSPIASIGELQHAPLSVFPWHPTYAVGNGLADPRVPRNATTNYFTSADWKNIGWHSQRNWTWVRQLHLNSTLENNSYLNDLSYESNFALWDSYFISTIPQDSAYRVGDPIANPRMVIGSDAGTPDITQLQDFHRAAQHCSIQGGFNINSTSKTAWAALLASFRDDLGYKQTMADGKELLANDIYSRLIRPYDVKYTDEDITDEEMWKGYRQLSDDQILSLADEIVKEVKRRGPFLSIADFVNRRLVDPPKSSGGETEFTKTGLKGTLQAAIDRTEINKKHSEEHIINKAEYSMADAGTRQVQYGSSYPNLKFPVQNGDQRFGPKPDHHHWADTKLVGTPSFLTQADILQKLGPVLCARGDTFVIRAYGEALDRSGNVTACAWCEATVQRTPTPVSPDLAGIDPETDKTKKPATIYGRKYEIIAFRWLNKNEI